MKKEKKRFYNKMSNLHKVHPDYQVKLSCDLYNYQKGKVDAFSEVLDMIK